MFERKQTYVNQRTLLPPHSRERFSDVPDTSGEVSSIPEDAVSSSANADQLQSSSGSITRTRSLPKRPRLLTTSEDDDPVESAVLDDPVEEDIDGADDTCRENSTRSFGGAELHAKRNKGKTSTVHEHFALIQNKVNGKMVMVRKCGICGKEFARGTLKRHLTDKQGDKVSSNSGHTYQTTLSAAKKGIRHSSTVISSQLTDAQQVTLNMMFLKLLIMAGLSFRLAENPHLL
ncbi:hypothetical protein PsorP6_018592 [Peronosclerospora sorghi]|nr:hypothetical protein PsorP6_018595 [Peronosclerospora sorghi]KAI9895252.1 hypothetical protein PsorP6_018592 [Peronosclerospora sorghi]